VLSTHGSGASLYIVPIKYYSRGDELNCITLQSYLSNVVYISSMLLI
jgi:hypothetical protein